MQNVLCGVKNMTDEFKRIIDEDIEACEIELKSGSKQSRNVLHTRLISKYGNIIDGFKDNLKSLFYDDSGSYVQQKIEKNLRQRTVAGYISRTDTGSNRCPIPGRSRRSCCPRRR